MSAKAGVPPYVPSQPATSAHSRLSTAFALPAFPAPANGAAVASQGGSSGQVVHGHSAQAMGPGGMAGEWEDPRHAPKRRATDVGMDGERDEGPPQEVLQFPDEQEPVSKG